MDQTVLDFFNQTLASPTLDLIMPILTIYGLFALPIIGLLLYADLFSAQTRKLGSTILLAQAVGFVLTFIFYYLALRTRPDSVRLIVPQPNFPSFPSGHAALAFSTAMVLVLFSGQAERNAGRWKIVAFGSAFFAFLIAMSRLYLGHHYPTDVIAGSVLGIATGASIFGLMLAGDVGVRRFRWLLWLQIAVAILVTMMAYQNLLPYNLLSWPFADKVLHFLLFGAIAFWLYLWMPNAGIKIGRWLLPMAILLPITIAFLEELLQGTSPLRTASGADLAFDLAGMICFCLLAQWLLKRDGEMLSSPVADAVE